MCEIFIKFNYMQNLTYKVSFKTLNFITKFAKLKIKINNTTRFIQLVCY